MTAAFPREDDLILRLITYELERLQNNTRDVINNDFLAVTACCGLLAGADNRIASGPEVESSEPRTKRRKNISRVFSSKDQYHQRFFDRYGSGALRGVSADIRKRGDNFD
jgi:hypothetical protein